MVQTDEGGRGMESRVNSTVLLCDFQKQPGPEGTARTVVIQERRLHVGVHNGWCFLDKPQVVVLEPVASGAKGRVDSTSRLSTPVKDRWAEETCVSVCSGSVAVGCWSIVLSTDKKPEMSKNCCTSLWVLQFHQPLQVQVPLPTDSWLRVCQVKSVQSVVLHKRDAVNFHLHMSVESETCTIGHDWLSETVDLN